MKLRVEVKKLEQTHRVKKFSWENSKHRAEFKKHRVKTFPTIVITDGKREYSRTTGFRRATYIKKMKGADKALKPKKDETWLLTRVSKNYSVSSLGRVRNNLTMCVLKPRPNHSGRMQVRIGGKNISVSRLVLESFIGPAPPGKNNALHRVNDLTDNSLNNLYWGSLKENQRDSRRDGTKFDAVGELNGRAKLNADKVREIKRLRKEGKTNLCLAKKFGVSKSTIARINTRTAWAHV